MIGDGGVIAEAVVMMGGPLDGRREGCVVRESRQEILVVRPAVGGGVLVGVYALGGVEEGVAMFWWLGWLPAGE